MSNVSKLQLIYNSKSKRLHDFIKGDKLENIFNYDWEKNIITSSKNIKEEEIVTTLNLSDYFNQSVSFKLTNYNILLNAIFFKCIINGNGKGEDKSETERTRWAWVKNIGFNIIEKCTLKINNTDLDTIYGDWIYIWYDIYTNINNSSSLYNITNNLYNKYDDFQYELNNENNNKYELLIPLNFFFNSTNTILFPLILFNESNNIEITLKIRDSKFLINQTTHKNFGVTRSLTNPSLVLSYIELSENEKEDYIKNNFKNKNNVDILKQLNNRIKSKIILNSNNIKLPIYGNVDSLYWYINLKKYSNNETFLDTTLVNITKRFILGFFYINKDGKDNKKEIFLGDTFKYINKDGKDNKNLFDINSHIQINFRSFRNKNNKNIQEIVNSAYVNKYIDKEHHIDKHDIEVDELLPIEIASMTIADINKLLFEKKTPRTDNIYGRTDEDIIYNDLFNFSLHIDRTENIIENNILKMNDNIIFNKSYLETTSLAKYYQYIDNSNYNNQNINIYNFSIYNKKINNSYGSYIIKSFNNLIFNFTFNKKIFTLLDNTTDIIGHFYFYSYNKNYINYASCNNNLHNMSPQNMSPQNMSLSKNKFRLFKINFN